MAAIRAKIPFSRVIALLVVLLAILSTTPAFAFFYGTWMKHGEHKTLYKLEKDSGSALVGHSSVRLSSTKASNDESVKAAIRKHADPFRKSRVKISGHMKIEGVSTRPYFFVYLYNQGFRSSEVITSWSSVFLDPDTQGWQPFEIVLDVPATSWNLDYGFDMTGSGSIWVDGLGIQKVSSNTPLSEAVIVQSNPENLRIETLPQQSLSLPPQWSFSPDPTGCAKVVGRDDNGQIRLSWDCPKDTKSSLIQVISAQGRHGTTQSLKIDGKLISGKASPMLMVSNSHSWSKADGTQTAPLTQCLSVDVSRKGRRVYFGLTMSGKGEVLLKAFDLGSTDCGIESVAL